mgnify:FL=1
MPVEEESLPTKAGASAMVPEARIIHGRTRVPQDVGRPLHVCEEI